MLEAGFLGQNRIEGRQIWDAPHYEENARFVSDLAEDALCLLAAQSHERILDLGCGDGVLSARIAQQCHQLVGVDTAPSFVDAARTRNIDAYLMDVMALDFVAEFDAVFSNAVLHWIPDINAALTGVRRALRNNGRFVGEFGGHGNVAAIRVALAAVLAQHNIDATPLNPWYFPTSQAFAEQLSMAGFSVQSIALIPRPTLLPTGMQRWLEGFASVFFVGLAPDLVTEIKTQILSLLKPILCDDQGQWYADYVRLRFAAKCA